MSRFAVLGAVSLIVVAGCDGSASGAPPTFVARGHVLLVGGESIVHMSHDDSCWGLGRYTWIDTGTPIQVSGAGDRRGGRLGPSHTQTDDTGTVITGCRFDFEVTGVPSGHDRYTVQVGTTRQVVDAATLRKGATIRLVGAG